MPLAAFVAGKKVHNKACKRNKAKRRFREGYRLLRSALKAASNQEVPSDDKVNLRQWYALVWVIQDKALGAEFKDIMSSIQSCLQRANQKFGARRASSKAP
jgi:RNase P protein component